MIVREAIKALVDDIVDLAMARADEWMQQGVKMEAVRPALLTAASHSAARILMTIASDDAKPKNFIRSAAPIVAEQIVEYAVPIMDTYIAALREQERRERLS